MTKAIEPEKIMLREEDDAYDETKETKKYWGLRIAGNAWRPLWEKQKWCYFWQAHGVDCHHKVPTENGGTDRYSNLIILYRDVHTLFHAVQLETINAYLSRISPTQTMLKKINKLRQMAGNATIWQFLKFREISCLYTTLKWWNAVCGETRTHGVERGKILR